MGQTLRTNEENSLHELATAAGLRGWTRSVHAPRWKHMAFELFTSSQTSEPFISLVKDGFRVSAGFLRTHHLEKATAVRLNFDRAKHAIGFQFLAGAPSQNGTLRPKRHAGGLVVRAQGFFWSRDIEPAHYAGRYRPQEIKDRVLGRLFVIQLHTSTSGRRQDQNARMPVECSATITSAH
jgi:hypothetical protein